MPASTKRKAKPDNRAGGNGNRRRRNDPPVEFHEFSQVVALLNDLSLEPGSDVNGVDATDLAIYIHNKGNEDERARALLGIVPTAVALRERLEAENDARHAKKR